MRILLKTLAVISCIWAIYIPSVYAALFTIFRHHSALIDATLVIGCVALAATVFIKVKLSVAIASSIVVVAFSFSGLFHHFQDSGASGPLPYEWLNDYYLHSVPLLVVVIINYLWLDRAAVT